MTVVGPAGPQPVLRDSYLGATTAELQRNSVRRRLVGLVNQKLLFPHRGAVALADDRIELCGWRTVRRGDVVAVERGFIPEYGRVAAGGLRGGFPSFGFIESIGAPLVIRLRSGSSIVLLVGYTWWSGASKNRSWKPAVAARLS